jgi:hypothetical protein
MPADKYELLRNRAAALRDTKVRAAEAEYKRTLEAIEHIRRLEQQTFEIAREFNAECRAPRNTVRSARHSRARPGRKTWHER